MGRCKQSGDEFDQLAFDAILKEGQETETYSSMYKTQDKISNMIGRDIREIHSSVEHMVPVGVDQMGDQVITKIQLSCEDLDEEEVDKNLKKIQNLNPFRRCCLDSLLTLYIHKGGHPFSLNQLYRVLMGKTSRSIPTEKQAEELSDAVSSLSRIGIKIFLEDEIESYGEKVGWGTTPQRKWISGTLFPSEQIAIEINGNITIAIKPLGPPILYRYALPKRQLLGHSMELVTKTKGKISNNRVILLDFLIRYVSMLFRVKKPIANNGIKFDTLYEICGVGANNEKGNTITKQKKRIRDGVIDILNSWQELGHIKNYEFENKGRSPYKIYITINEKSPYIPSLFVPNEEQNQNPC